MRRIYWNLDKERILKKDVARNNISFYDCVVAIEDGRILADLPHPLRENQRLLILNIENYAYVAPYVLETDGSLFLKTVFPSRKHTALYLGKDAQ